MRTSTTHRRKKTRKAQPPGRGSRGQWRPSTAVAARPARAQETKKQKKKPRKTCHIRLHAQTDRTGGTQNQCDDDDVYCCVGESQISIVFFSCCVQRSKTLMQYELSLRRTTCPSPCIFLLCMRSHICLLFAFRACEPTTEHPGDLAIGRK